MGGTEEILHPHILALGMIQNPASWLHFESRLLYYALPLLWGEKVIGWGNVSMVGGRMQAGLGYVAGKPPSGAAFSAALDEELQRMETFLQAGASEKGEPLANNSDGET